MPALLAAARPSRESRDGQVEAAPEEMHRTGLADERAARAREDALTLDEDAPERFGVRGIVTTHGRCRR